MATAAKKSAAALPRKAVAPRQPTDRPRKRAAVQDLPMPEVEVLVLSSEDAPAEPDLVEVFRLDGKPYHIDRNIGAGVALRLLKAMKNEGENAALGGFLVEVLGDEAFDAFASFPGVTVTQMAQVMQTCVTALMGDAKTGPKA